MMKTLIVIVNQFMYVRWQDINDSPLVHPGLRTECIIEVLPTRPRAALFTLVQVLRCFGLETGAIALEKLLQETCEQIL